MNRYNQIFNRRLKRKELDWRRSDFDSKKRNFKKIKKEQEVESEYGWLLEFAIENAEEIRTEVQNENANENEKEYEDEDVDVDVDEDEDEDEDVDVYDENDKDPEYCKFLENLTEHGKSYKLRISQDNEELRFLYYEEQDNSNSCDELQTCIDNSGDELTSSGDLQINQKAKGRLNEKNREISTKKEVSTRKKVDDHKSVIEPHRDMRVDSSYQAFPNGCIPSEHVAVKLEENSVEHEKNATTSDSDSDSDVVILDNVQNCSEVNNKNQAFAEKEPSLREKLMHILKRPYNVKEYEELSESIEQKKPMCRHLDLRGRPISSSFGGAEKSVLDDVPGSFRRMLNAAQNDPPKALNLLRMFYFWLEHVPNEDVFAPWKDKDILNVRPSDKKAKSTCCAAFG